MVRKNSHPAFRAVHELSEAQVLDTPEHAYWMDMFHSGLSTLDLPYDFPLPATRTFARKTLRFELSGDTVAAIRQFSRQGKVTPFMIGFAAFATLISKCARQEDVVIGTVSSGRFANTLAIRTQVNQQQGFGEFLQYIRELLSESFTHDAYPYDELIRSLEKSGKAVPPLNALFSMLPKTSAGQAPALDLSFIGTEGPGGISFDIEYSTELFRPETIERLFARFELILQQVLAAPDMLLEDIDIVLEEERRLLDNWNDTTMPYPADQTIHGMFEAQAARTPDLVALYFNDQELTYEELDQKANQLARTLREMGVRPQEVVGIMVERSLEMVIGMFAILKAGGAYLPLEPSIPEVRLEFMLQDSASKVMLVQGHLFDKIPTSFQGHCLNLDDEASYAADGRALTLVNKPTDLAYVIYTSGSTGQPKGVMIEHHAVLNRIVWIQDHYRLGPGQVHLQKTPITFDVSVSELFWWSFYGASLAILEPGAHRHPDLLVKAVERYQVNVIHFVPSMLTAFQDYLASLPDTQPLASLQQVYTTGEVLGANQVAALYQYLGEPLRITNLYGPTEATIEVTWFDCERGQDYRSIPIGKPIYNTEMYVLNPQGRIQPINVPGELCIGGVQVARGYQNRDELNADRFVPNPFRAGEKMYRTGDLARWLPNGEIEFLGRMDHQVKIRGYRIELGEIEHALMGLESISDTVVIDRTDSAGNKYLCAYYLADEELPVNQARAHLAQSLPEYMIPARFVRMDSFPLTSSGKTDRKALPEPEDMVTTGTEFVPPATDIEKGLAAIWGAVLGLDPEHIGIRDNLFALGGDSIRSVQIASQASVAWHADISLKDIFEYPTIEQLGRFIEEGEKGAHQPIPQAQSNSYYPLSSAQKRIFLHSQLQGTDSTLYNLPMIYELAGKLDHSRLKMAFQQLVSHYEVFRSSFGLQEGKLVQFISGPITVDVPVEIAAEDELDAIFSQWGQEPFALDTAPLIRLKLVETPAGRQYLLLDSHHIVMDGLSYEPFFSALARAYQGEALEDQPLEYKDYAVWQQSEEQQEKQAVHREYWLDMYKDGVPVLEWPADFQAPAARTFAGAVVQLPLSDEMVAGIRQLSAREGVTPFMILYSAFALLISRYVQQEEVVIGTVSSGRSHPQLTGLLGMFVNTLAIRTQVDKSQSFNQFLQSVKSLLLESFANDSYPYDELVSALKKGGSTNSLFNAMFTMLSEGGEKKLGGQVLRQVKAGGPQLAMFDLTFGGVENTDGIHFEIEYAAELFSRETVESLFARFEHILSQLLENPEIGIGQIAIVLDKERDRMERWNDTAAPFPADKAIHQLFEEQAARTPGHTALTFESLKLTYRELNEKANCLAAYLLDAGLKPETLVGLCMDRSAEMIISILAIWKAGGAYVPLDPGYPVDRLRFMSGDAGIKLMLTQQSCQEVSRQVVPDSGGRVLVWEDLEKVLAKHSPENPGLAIKPSNLAYVIYTSGSTGNSKGALLEHKGLCNLVSAQIGRYEVDASSKVLQLASISFDTSLWEILLALCSGAELVLASRADLMPGKDLEHTINRFGVTHLTAVPSALAILDPERLPTLQVVVSGGEALKLETARHWAEKTRLYNAYGPTEASIEVSVSRILPGDKRITIGKPLENTRLYVLDTNGRLLPPGLAGELCIAGVALARGYLNRPEMTAEKFVADPFHPGELMYRTGDLVRWSPDGEIEFLGRIDHQVKIRGYRIECGEIENALLSSAELKDVAVIDRVSENGQAYLCAYFVSDQPLTVEQLRGKLASKLPDYMIPARFMHLESLPLSPNGKVDRQALPEPAGVVTTGAQFVPPGTHLEKQLALIWAETLNLDPAQIGIHDNFFLLGGDSIRSVQLAGRIGEECNKAVSVKDIFERPTISGQAELIASRKDEALAGIPKAAPQEYYPLSSAQKRVYLHSQLQGAHSVLYNMPVVFELTGKVEHSRLKTAFQQVVDQVEIFRSTFGLHEGQLVQSISGSIAVDVPVEIAAEDELKAIFSTWGQEPFALDTAPLIRLKLVETTAGRQYLLLDSHHIVMDGLSYEPFFFALAEAYQGEALEKLLLDYKDYAVWQQSEEQQAQQAFHREYWLDMYQAGVPVLELPTDFPAPAARTFAGAVAQLQLSDEVAAGIRQLSAREGATPFMILYSAFALLLSKYSRQEDIVIGLTSSGRNHPQLENLIGMLVNTLAVRTKVGPGQSFGEFLQATKQLLLEAFDHDSYPFEALSQDLKKNGQGNPLFNVMFTMIQEGEYPALGGSELRLRETAGERLSKFDLTFSGTEGPGGISFDVEYSTELFRTETIERLLARFEWILQQALAAPDMLLEDIDIVLDEERQLLDSWNDTTVPYPREKTIHELFEEQASRTPDHVALVFEGQEMTYRELNERANALSRYLLDAGVGRETLVGVCLERSTDLIVSLLAILKAGGAYLPIDAAYPQDRIAFMLEDSQAPVILSQEAYLAALGELPAMLICLDRDWPQIARHASDDIPGSAAASDLAYVIYTSGTTGRPKGVMVSHQNISRLVINSNYLAIGPEDRFLQYAPVSFDAATLEIWGSLLNGATLVIAPAGQLSTAELRDYVAEQGVTLLWLTSALFRIFAMEDLSALKALRALLSGGDVLPVESVRRVLEELPGCTLINGYGPTENTTFTTCFEIATFDPDWRSIPIGKPISNTTVYILDENRKPLPIGVPGELYTGGDGVARGYLNRPELTAEKFIDSPFKAGERLYRTGDLVRWLPDGHIEFLGRIDQQVKIRGYRIECGEIEHALNNLPQIKDSVVMARVDQSGHKYLCAYYLPDESVSVENLREALLERLPDYMVPARFMELGQLPLTPNGKVDRKALPAPEGIIHAGSGYVAPATEVEKQLATIWSEILYLDPAQIGIHDNFFLLGGDSIRSVQLAGRISKECNKAVSVKDIFERPTISGQAELIALRKDEALAGITKAAPQEYYPLSSAQKRVYLHSQLQGAHTVLYNMPVVFELTGKVEHSRLKTAFQQVVDHVEIFRSTFGLHEGQLVQSISGPITVDLPIEIAAEDELETIFSSWGQEPFALDNAPLIRLKLVETTAGRQYLLLDSHHIVMDGLSYEPFFSALASAYQGEALEDLSLDYKDYALWQQSEEQQVQQAAHRAYWLDMYQGGVPVLELPTDFPAPATRTFAGAVAQLHLSEEIAAGIRQLSAREGATPFMMLYSAFALLISKYSRQEDIVIGLTSSGRNHPQLENLIGMLVNTLAVRTKVGPGQSFGEFLQATKQLLLEAFDHDSYPFEALSQDLKKNGQGNPLFNVLFTMIQEGEYPALGDSGLRLREIAGERLSKFDLTFSGYERKNSFTFEAEYSTELFRPETIERLFARFELILRQVLAAPDRLLEDIDIVLDEERLLLDNWNDTAKPYPADQTIHGMFEAQAARTPGLVALYFGDQQLSYEELDRKANQLARTLRKMGVRPQEVVGIMAERSIEMMIGIFAILKAGGAYLPLDPSLPEGRLEFMLQDSASNVALVQGHLLDKVPTSFQGHCLNLDDEASYAVDGCTLPLVNKPNDLAYIIYTSGSTGQPKGVMIEHHAVLNRIAWIQDHYPLGPGQVHLQKTPITFDVSVSELFWWSFYGASLAILEPGAHRHPDLLVKAVERYRVNIIHFVPSMLTAFLDHLVSLPDTQALGSLRQVYASGEALGANQAVALYHYLGEPLRITNLYGPTEATIEVTWFDCERGRDYRSIPIGKPIYNTEMYVLNPQGRVQPVNVPGELCIGGVQVARGYQNRDELNADRFVANPFRAGEKMYRTGDLARWLPNGEIEFLGRMDHQVKIRGYRIELGEIEHALMSLDSISDAVVIDRADDAGNKYLCAYYLADEELPVNQARAHLAQSLPEYMIPARFVRMDSFPLTSSGKTDRKALPEPEGMVTTGTEFVSPATDIEKGLAAIWGAVLGLDPEHIGIRDNLFALGGDSIRSVQIASLASEAWHADISLKDIFEYPTIEQLGRFIEEGEKGAHQPIPQAQSNSFYPASSAQKRIYLHQQMEGEGSTLYNMPIAFEWQGALDLDRLEAAFQQLVATHEILRTGFETRDGQLVQIIQEEASVAIEREIISEANLAEAISNWVEPFDLNRPPLMRLKVLSTREGAQYLLLDTHHIVMDGMSYGPLFDALARAYEGNAPEAPALQYKDYAVWQQSEEQQEQQAAHREYWMDMYATGLPVLELPTDFPAPAARAFAGDNLRFKLPKESVAELRQLGARTGATPFMILYSAFALLICKYAQQEEVVIGTVTSGRNHPQLKDILGMLVNTLAIRSKVEGEQTFTELLTYTKQLLLESYSHDSYPYEELARSLKTGKNGNSLFDVVFTLFTGSEWPALGGASLREVEMSGHEKAKFGLTFHGTDLGEEIVFDVTFSTELYRKETIQQLARRFTQVLEQTLDNPKKRVREIGILLDEERRQLESWNLTEASFPADQTIHGLFEAQAAALPDRIALLFEDLELSYAELDEKANRLAHYLVKVGVQPEMLVGVCMERSPEMIISFLAVWKAGCAYVPLDPAYPLDRLAYMIADAQIGIVLTDEACQAIAKEAAGEHPAGIFTIGSLEEELAQMPAGNLEAASAPESLAYVIYTSGSTGQPKGVMIEHRSACNLVFAQRTKVPVSPSAIVLQFASTSFDASVLEILMALCNGAALVVAGKEDLMPGPELTATLNRYQVSHCVLSPTAMGQLDPAQLPHLKWVISGGEALPLSLIQKWAGLIKVVNEYGPTEATVAATAALTTAGQEQVTIGRPFPNYRIYILGRHQELLSPGLPGEIHIAGAGLARGYLNRPELTAGKFVANPFGSGGRMYKTGDLGRWLPNGEIEFLGRIDHQVKIRGFRIECGEIESALMGMAGIREVAVVDKTDTHGQKFLCAYYVSENTKAVGELRAFLAGFLPDFMIPSLFESLERLPLTPNGKVDRKALQSRAVAFTLRENGIVPRNTNELQLCRIWQSILEVPEIGIGDNFFEWGGDSIKAIPLIDKIQEAFRVRIPVHAIFQNPTVELLARHLALVKAEQGSRDPHLIPLQGSGTRPPLFFAPGVEGKCYYLYELAQAIGKDQPLYGFQSCGLQPGEEALESIEAIAGFNIRLMKAVQPVGPYYLAGHSLGGWVAYEMAHQLIAQGEEVAFLGLMDSYSPRLLARLGMLSPATDDPGLNDLMLAVERLAAYYHVDVETDSLLQTLKTMQAGDRLDFVLRWAMELKLLPPSFSAQELWQWAHLMGAYSRMSYHPPRISREIHLFRAMDQELPPHQIPEYLGWEEHTAGKVRKIMVPGTHTSMMKQPHVGRLANILLQQIGGAASAHDAQETEVAD